jgi:serine/threonine protein kinase
MNFYVLILIISNILLKNNHIKIGDFGFAVNIDIITKLERGTLGYLSPEIMYSKKIPVTTKADIW